MNDSAFPSSDNLVAQLYVSADLDIRNIAHVTHPKRSPECPDEPDFCNPLENTSLPGWIAEQEQHISPEDFQSTLSSYFKPLVPCHYCAARQLDCKVFLNEGNQQCFACISLFRTCSFIEVNPMATDGHIDTLHPVNEDVTQELGMLTGLKPYYTAGASRDVIEQKPGKRFSKEVLQVLRAWVNNHGDHVYPSEEEKATLQHSTGLTRNQISNWFANARRRGQLRPKRNASPSVQSRSLPIDVGSPSRSYGAAEKSHMTPFERWKDSPPENEAPISILAREAESSQFQQGESNGSSTTPSANQPRSSGGSALSRLRAPSLSSLETGLSSGSTKSRSAWSQHSSQGSYNSFAKKDRRRRRRSGVAPLKIKTSADTTNAARPFQCTFCVDTFRTKYDWTRHEKSMHLNLEKWTCCPNGKFEACSVRNLPVCAYCRSPERSLEHLETHNHTVCASKDAMARTFLRKDHLRQHLRLVHGVAMRPSMDLWRSIPSEVRSRCGFCNAQFKTWEDRASHLAGHFHSGATMGEWTGGWGLDPEVAACVTDAMPPWLIPLERSKPFP